MVLGDEGCGTYILFPWQVGRTRVYEDVFGLFARVRGDLAWWRAVLGRVSRACLGGGGVGGVLVVLVAGGWEGQGGGPVFVVMFSLAKFRVGMGGGQVYRVL